MYIVQGEEAEPEYLVGDVEMPDVGSAESSAGGAIAVDVERSWIGAELGALDVEPAVPREDSAIPSHARWCHAVEQIDTSPNRLNAVFGEAHTHEIARISLGQRFVHDVEDLIHRVLLLAD